MTTHTHHIFKFEPNYIQINSNHIQQQPAAGLPRAPTMGAMRRNHNTNRGVSKLSLLSFFLSAISLFLLLNVSTTHRSPTTMAIATRSQKAAPVSRATAATTASPAERHRTKRLSKSPNTSNVNIFLADINRPMTYTDSVLQVLQPKYSTPDDPEANPEKGRQMTALDSPTGVDNQAGAPGALDEAAPPQDHVTALDTQPPKSSRSVTISETATTGTPVGGIFQGTAVSPNIAVHQSILLSLAKNASSTKDPEGDSGYTPPKIAPEKSLTRTRSYTESIATTD